MEYSFSHSLDRKEAAALSASLLDGAQWKGWVFVVVITGLVAGAVTFGLLYEVFDRLLVYPPRPLLVFAMIAAVWAFIMIGQKASRHIYSLPFRKLPKRWPAEWHIQLREEDIILKTDYVTSWFEWSGVVGFIFGPDGIAILFETHSLYIPESCLSKMEGRSEFYDHLREWAPDDAITVGRVSS